MPASRPLNPKKLLLSKWTAVQPHNREKHFIVIKLLKPELPNGAPEEVELQAVYSKRSLIMPWRQLTAVDQWLQGWK